jgi:hypothetical protein
MRKSKALTLAITALLVLPALAGAQVPDAVDCLGPAGEAEAGTPEWRQRELANWTCSHLGMVNQDTNPAARQAYLEMRADPASVTQQGLSNLEADPLRYPPLRWDGKRGNWRFLTFTAPYGNERAPGPETVAPFPVFVGSGVVPQEVASDQLGAQLFAPLEECTEGAAADCPEGVPTHPAGPYPIVVLQGGAMGNSN